jgi:subtilase family serine protease
MPTATSRNSRLPSRRIRFLVPGVVGLTVLGLVGLASVAAAPAPAQVATASRVRAADPSATVQVSFVLRGRDPSGLRQFLVDVSDPASPAYHHFLTPQQLGDRFGLPQAEQDALVARLTADGLTVVSHNPQRSRLVVRGSAAQLGAMLGVVIEQRREASGVTHLAAAAQPVVPADLASVVSAVTGLDPDLPVSAAKTQSVDPPARGLKPMDLALAYDFKSLWDAGITGAGQNVAIIQFGVDTDADLAVYDQTFGIQAPDVERIPVDGGLKGAPADFAPEAALDTQVVRAVAPGAQILVYGFPANEPFGASIDAVVADGRAKVISISYGGCFSADHVSKATYEDTKAALARAAAAGVTLFAASGDWGAFVCHAFDPKDPRVTTFFPACTDNVVGVGGTSLDTRADGSYLRETGWEDYLSTAGTGGGLSPLDARPPWQKGVPGIDNASSDGSRQCPDVAAVADSFTGYLVYLTDPKTGEAGWQMVGGTSAATPFWAGVMALVQQAASQKGITQLGFLAPLLYRVAASDPGAFHDVQRGGNLVEQAGAGWDYATGLGSPDVALLSDAIIRAQP